MNCRRTSCKRLAAKNRYQGYCQAHYYALSTRGYVDATECRQHIRALRDAGYSLAALADMSGLHPDTLGDCFTGERVEVNTYLMIMGIPLPPGIVDGGARIPNVGTKRRLQSLMAAGYAQPFLAQELNVTTRQAVGSLLRKSLVSSASAVKVKDLFDRLQAKQGPSKRAANYAAQQGWLPPLAWDDDIDNPDAVPQMPEGDKNAWFDDYQELKALGKTDEEIAERMGILLKSLKTRLWRLQSEITCANQEHQPVREGREQMVRADR